MKEYLTSEQVCKILHICRRTLYRYVKAGLPSHKIRKHRLYVEKEIREFIEGKRLMR